jgi:adenosylcobinamide-GDP ribazoletransferase
MKLIQPFLIALQFLTIIPVRLSSSTSASSKQIGQSLLFYPIVGLLISGLLLVTAWLLNTQSALVSAVLILTLWVFLTGGLHLDGLADSADAWLGGLGDKAKTLLIMKDPASGPVAVTLLILVLLIKFIMLVELLRQQNYLAIVFAVTLARCALPLLFLTTPYVRQGGIGAILVANQPRAAIKCILASTVVLSLIFSGFTLLLSGFIVFLILRYAMELRLNGTTGDTAGAMVEILETTILITAVII